MPAATEPPPPLKPSRYRTIRSKNAPESRRYIEPTQTPVTSAAASTASTPPSNSIPFSNSTNSMATANSSSTGSGFSDTSSRRPTMMAPSAPLSNNNNNNSNDRPSFPVNGGYEDETVPANRPNGRNMADAVQHTPPTSQQHHQQEQQPQQQLQQPQQQQQPSTTATAAAAKTTSTPSRFRKRPPPPRPARLETSFPTQPTQPAADAPLSMHTPATAAAPTPSSAAILVPLPSARARGLEHEMLAGESALDADEVARRDAEAERLLAEQKRKDLERLERELANHQSASANLPPKSPAREKFSFLSRRRGLSSAAPPTPPTTHPQTSSSQPPPIPASPKSPVLGSSRPTTAYNGSRSHSGSEPPLPNSLASAAAPQMDIFSSAPGSGVNQVCIRASRP